MTNAGAPNLKRRAPTPGGAAVTPTPGDATGKDVHTALVTARLQRALVVIVGQFMFVCRVHCVYPGVRLPAGRRLPAWFNAVRRLLDVIVRHVRLARSRPHVVSPLMLATGNDIDGTLVQ